MRPVNPARVGLLRVDVVEKVEGDCGGVFVNRKAEIVGI
jgi:hypothetical protein